MVVCGRVHVAWMLVVAMFAVGLTNHANAATGTPDTCATTITAPTDTCPVTMKLVAATPPAGDTAYRVGDIVRINLSLATTRPVTINGVQAYANFPADTLQLVTGPTDPTPLTTAQSPVSVASGAFGINATLLRNAYTEAGTTPNRIGQIDLDLGIFLPQAGVGTPVGLAVGTDTVVGSFYVRVRTNPTTPTNLALTLRDSAATGGRIGIVAVVNGPTGTGFNILGPVTGATLTVAQTTAELSAVPATPSVGMARRIGDVVPVEIILNATTALRNATTLQTTITFNPADLALVTNASTTPPPDVTTGATAGIITPATVGNAFGSGVTIGQGYAVAVAVGTVTIDLRGPRLALVAGSAPTVVATIYVRPLRRGDLTLTVATAMLGEIVTGTTTPLWTVTTTPGGVATVEGVRGSIGVGLTVTSPVALASTQAPSLAIETTGGATSTFTVTDGRILDVQLAVLAGGLDSRQADRFVIDLTYDPTQLQFATAPVAATDYVLATDIVADGTAVAVGTGVVQVSLKRTATPTLLAAPTPLIRLRFVALRPGATATTTVALGVGSTTVVRQSTGTRFSTNLYDNGRDARLDQIPVVTRQQPATLTLDTRLQGRATTDPDARFAQAIRVTLHRRGEATPATRLYQATNPPTLLSDPSLPVGIMRYSATSAKKAGATDPLATTTFPDLEPGSYDLRVKGRSSLTVTVLGVTLPAGSTILAPATGSVTLPEGDTDADDAVNGYDFVALSRGFGTETTDTADLNQSGYVDAADFSLLARNFALAGPATLATLGVIQPIPPSAIAGTVAQSHTLTLTIPIGTTLTSARLIVGGTPGLPVTCAATQPVGTSCASDTATRVTLDVVSATGTAGSGGVVTLGTIQRLPTEAGRANFTITLAEATGRDGATPANPITFRAPLFGAVTVVDPATTYALTATATAGVIVAGIDLTIGGSKHVSGGRATISYDASQVQAGASCDLVAPGVLCTTAVPGTVALTIDPASADLTGTVTLATVTLTPRLGITGTGEVRGAVAALVDGRTLAGTRTPLSVATATIASDVRQYTLGSGSVTVTQVRTTAVAELPVVNGPSAVAWLLAPSVAVAPGSIIAVPVGLTTGTRAIDAMQLALIPGDGFDIVDANGAVATTTTAWTAVAGSPLPVTLRRVLAPDRRLLEVTLGRQVGGSAAGVTGSAVLGTVYLRVGPTATSGAALRIGSTGAGRFVTTAVSEGTNALAGVVRKTGSTDPETASVIVEVTVGRLSMTATNDPIDEVTPIIAPVMRIAPVTPAIASAPTGVATAPPPTSMAAVTRAPVATGASATTGASAIVQSATVTTGSAGITAISGRDAIAVAGRRGPIELATGVAMAEPDAWCPTVRYRTYIRLEDIGLRGATFGVGAGGVLAWVTPNESGCVDWEAITREDRTFGAPTIMQFRLARAVPGALLWVLEGRRHGELYEVDSDGIANYITAEVFGAQQLHFVAVWPNVIPVGTGQIEDLSMRGLVHDER